jgi:hypothetical protein
MPEFNPWAVCVGFVREGEVALGRVFCEYLAVPLPSNIPRILHMSPINGGDEQNPHPITRIRATIIGNAMNETVFQH